MRRYDQSTPAPWWGDDIKAPRDRARAIIDSARAIERATAGRYTLIRRAEAAYGQSAGLATSASVSGAKPLKENVLASACDTWVNHVGQNTPRPMWMSVDGDYDAQERARLLMGWWDALVERTALKTLRLAALRSAGLTGIGALQPYRPAPGRPVAVERVHSINVVMDDALGLGMPTEVYRRRVVARSELLELYPQHREAIEQAPGVRHTTWFLRSTTLDAVEVWESWHTSAVEPADPDDPGLGRHCGAAADALLFDEPWRSTRPGIVCARAIPPPSGYWGLSYYERSVASAEEYNRCLRLEQESLHVNAITRWILPNGSSLVDTSFDDGVGLMLRTSGDAIVPVNGPTLSGDAFGRIDRRRDAVFEAWGVSQLAANQQKPAGLESKPAFQAFADFQDVRHTVTIMEDAAAMVELARACVALERAEYERDPSHRVPCARGRAGMSSHPWPDIDLEDERVALQAAPAGILPASPAARLERIIDLRDKGLLDEETTQRMLDSPDLVSARTLSTAPTDWIHAKLSAIISHGRFDPPEPCANLQQALPIALRYLARAQVDDVPRARQAQLRRWIVEVVQLVRRQQTSAMKPENAGVSDEGVPLAMLPAPPAPPPGPMPPPGALPPQPPGMPPGAPMPPGIA